MVTFALQDLWGLLESLQAHRANDDVIGMFADFVEESRSHHDLVVFLYDCACLVVTEGAGDDLTGCRAIVACSSPSIESLTVPNYVIIPAAASIMAKVRLVVVCKFLCGTKDEHN